ncbi:hypothetical protein BDW22DRAFT_1352907 [Trametopsis cervina]|nr:hypothetical protein BDW22DRAFT_1352907 [Trametopsis cervina]
MEYVAETSANFLLGDFTRLQTALSLLHQNQLVFGDLRQPNVLKTTNGALLIDFDWCGTAGEARYPPDINMDLDYEDGFSWHPDVRPRGLLATEHDDHLLIQLFENDQ